MKVLLVVTFLVAGQSPQVVERPMESLAACHAVRRPLVEGALRREMEFARNSAEARASGQSAPETYRKMTVECAERAGSIEEMADSRETSDRDAK